MSGKRKPAQKEPESKTTVEDTAGKSPQDHPPPQKLKCFQDILDIVHRLSDEEWTALTSDAQRSKAEFASLCTNIVISVGKSAVKSFLPTLIHTLGMEAALTAEEQLKKPQSESRSPSDQSTTPTKPAASTHDSDERSTVEPSAFCIVDPFHKEVPLNKSDSSEDHEARPSSDQSNESIEDSGSHSTPDFKEYEGNVFIAKSERFLSKDTLVVSDLLVRSDRCPTLLSTFPSDHGIDEEDNVSKIGSSASRQSSVEMITAKPKGDVQEVSHISLRRAAPKTAWDELSQCSLASAQETSTTPILSVSSTNSDNASPDTTVFDAIDTIDDQGSSDSTSGRSTGHILISPDSECSVTTFVERVDDALDSEIESISLSSDMSEITASGIGQKPSQDDVQVYEAQYVWNEHRDCLDSCTDEIISKIVDLYCSEFSDVLSKESIQSLTSDSFHVLSKHLVQDVLWKFVMPLPAEEPMDMPSATSDDSDVLFKRSSSTLMKRLNSSASEIARHVCTAFQGFLGSVLKWEDMASDSLRLFALFHLFRDVREKLTEVFSLLSTSEKSDMSSTTNESDKCTVWTKSTRSTTPESKPATICSSAVSERSSNQENGVIFMKLSSAAEEITQHEFQRPSATNQLPPLITDECTYFHEVGLRKHLGSITGTSQACRSTSDSVMETSQVKNLLRDPIQVPLALVYPFVEESVKSLLLHFLCDNPELPNVTSPHQDMQGTSAGFESQSRNSGFQGVSTNAVSHFTKALADLVVKSLPSTGPVSGNKDDPLTLLVMPEQKDLKGIQDVSVMDFVSPSHLKRIASDVARETLENFIISSQEGLSSCSSSSPFNDSPVMNPDPVVLKKRPHGFCFNIFKKFNKVSPARLLSADHPLNNSPGNGEEALQTESKDLMTPFKKVRKRLSRICSSISKALPNPLCCMTRPS
ncbi:hypothetical protein MHYP_G00046620 [Metynnis hypsauchen]